MDGIELAVELGVLRELDARDGAGEVDPSAYAEQGVR